MPEYEVTLSGVAARLAQLSREMDSLTRALGELDRDAVQKRETYVNGHPQVHRHRTNPCAAISSRGGGMLGAG
jgi:hypothetical protein